MIKYPQKAKMFVSSDLKNLAKEMNDMWNPKFYVIGKLNVLIDPIIDEKG
jgi:hypothetical protein